MANTTVPFGSPLEQRMYEAVRQQMQKELDGIAEPIIKEALERIQQQLRERLGTMTLGLLRSTYNVRELNGELHITVHVKEPKL